MRPIARHDDPDFVPSLRLLAESEKYSLSDIGMMFGVSRERVRQWCNKYGIDHNDGRRAGHSRGLFAVRVWDDVNNRFRPIVKKELREARLAREATDRFERFRIRRVERRNAIITKAVELQNALGRGPMVYELAFALGIRREHKTNDHIILISHWGLESSRRDRVAAAFAELRKALGEAGVQLTDGRFSNRRRATA